MHSQKELLIMDMNDNIGIIKQEVSKGQKITILNPELENLIEVKEDIPFGFKIALKEIKQKDIIYKYGEAIGMASAPISKGEMVHVHNVEGLRGRGDLEQ
jgi:altronate dehydratase small subunit